MAKRTDSFETSLVLIEILRSMSKNRSISSSELQQLLADKGHDRSLRTIQRSLEKLADHYDIDCNTNSKPYSYRWKPEARGLDIPSLTTQQSLVLMLAEQQLKHLLPSNLLSSMQPFFDQARRQMIYDSRDKPEYQWLGKIGVEPMSQPLIPAQVDDEVFHAATTALFQNKYLEIHYRNQQGWEHRARVMPLALVQQEASSYLVVQYENSTEVRHLALHRILSAKVSTMTFERPIDFNLKRYQAEARFGFGVGQKIRFSFSIAHHAGFHLTETPLSVDQILLEQSEQHYRFQATVVDSERLDWWIAKFGEEIWDIEKMPLIEEPMPS